MMIFAFISVLSVIIVKLNIEIDLKNVEENQGIQRQEKTENF